MRFAGQKKRTAGLLLCLVAAALCGCAGSGPRTAGVSDRGWVAREILDTPPYAAFRAGYDSAKITPEFIPMIRNVREGVEVTIFFGGWCPDSKREVPRFLKLADASGFPASGIKLYALDRTKKSDDGLTDRYRIERIPTFIFLKEGKEIGRITESPSTTLEGDVLTILARGLQP
ncbi:MAG TPA: thioredoxin family protein [Bacteroidota bacterium]|nr:thioredoxin family protein [Bacteroidota bacterium]